MAQGNHSVLGLPKLQLVGFQRVSVEKGSRLTVTFTIKPEQLAVWVDDNTGWETLTGK